MADNYYHGYVILSEQEYQQLMRDGTITKNGTTINYDENTTYATAEAEIEAGVAYTQSDSDIAQHIIVGDVQDGTVVICNEKLTENEYQLGHLYKLSNSTGTWAATDITAGGSYTGSNGITISGDQIMLNENLFQAYYLGERRGGGIINIHTSTSGGRSDFEISDSNTNIRVLGGNTISTTDNTRYQQGVSIGSTGVVRAYRQKPLSDTENEYLYTDLIEPVVAGDNITVSRVNGQFKISSTGGGGTSYTGTNGVQVDGDTLQLSPYHFEIMDNDTTEGNVEISSAFRGKGTNYKSIVQIQDGATILLKTTQQEDGHNEIRSQLMIKPHVAELRVDGIELDLANPIVAGDNVEVYHYGNQIKIDAKTGGSYTGSNGVTISDGTVKLDENAFTVNSTMTSISSQNVSELSQTDSNVIANSDGTVLISTNQNGSGIDLSIGTAAKITENNMGTTTSTNLITPVKAGNGIAIERDADQLALSLSKVYRTPVTLSASGTYALRELAQRISSEADLDYFRIRTGTPFTVTANVTTINSDGTTTMTTETKSFEEFDYEAKSQYAHSAHFSVSVIENIVELELTAYNGVSSCMMFRGVYNGTIATVFSVRFVGQEITQDGSTTKISTWDSGDIDLKSVRLQIDYSIFNNTNR